MVSTDATVRSWIEAAQRIVALTGAGISTDSGIPDFRGPQGVWTRNPGAEKMATLQHYLADPEVRRRAWRTRLESPTWRARPNAGHRALVVLERRRKLDTLITQNVDGLHQMAGSSPQRVIEIHVTSRMVPWISITRWGDEPDLRRARAHRTGAGARPRRRGGPAVPDVRRHPQDGDDLVRSAAGAGGPGPRRGGRPAVRPAAGGRHPALRLADRPRCTRGQGGGRARGDRERRAHRDGSARRRRAPRVDQRAAAAPRRRRALTRGPSGPVGGYCPPFRAPAPPAFERGLARAILPGGGLGGGRRGPSNVS